jgi:hypothetical protein
MTRKILASWLLAIFAISAIGNYAWMLHKSPDTPPPAVPSLSTAIAQAHSVFMAMLIGTIFSDDKKRRTVGRLLAIVAIIFCVMWVAAFTTCWIGYPDRFNAGGPGGLVEQMNQRAAAASFLVAGMLGYLCSAPAKP